MLLSLRERIHLRHMRKGRNYKGLSYASRVNDVNAIYDKHARSGLSNREIWRRYIYPEFYISERTFYNYINATASEPLEAQIQQLSIVFI